MKRALVVHAPSALLVVHAPAALRLVVHAPAALLLVVAALSALLLVGCSRSTCAGSADPACTTVSACPALHFECAGGTAEVHVFVAGEPLLEGLDVLASPGDVVLSNDRFTAVIDAIDHPHYVAPSGGNLLDLTPAGGGDALTHMFTAVGLLPGDSVMYEHLFLSSGPGFAAVEARGRLAGHPGALIVTRYEARPCEPGLRVRTEVLNGTSDAQTWALVDAWYWSGRETLPFAPGVGTGFEQPGLTSPISSAWRPFPYFVAASHATTPSGYGEIPCADPTLHGFHTEQLSAVGVEPRVVPARDVEVFDRFIVATSGNAVASTADVLLGAREQLFGEALVEIRGTVQVAGDATGLGDEVRATIVIASGEQTSAPAMRTPWTQVTPDASGAFSARVPRHAAYVLDVQAFGRTVTTLPASGDGPVIDVGTIEVSPAARLRISTVTLDGVVDDAQLFVVPADAATREATTAQLFGGFAECAPLLGPSTGASPACDRALLADGLTFELPPGRYELVATAGPFATLDHELVTLAAGDEVEVAFELARLPVLPVGTLSADFHVHGAASFDSTIPDLDRVAAFLAAHVDVIATTDHDVVWDYAAARRVTDADRRLHVMVGLETTGHILFDLVPGAELPQVIGHWNVWPLPFELDGPYRGAPWDELAEPGLLMTRFEDSGWPAATGVVQLNHPWAPAQVGRDLGFPRAVGVDARVPLPSDYDGTGPSLILRTPPGARFGNADYQAQEVMNGTENEDLLPYRAYWFYLLSQGIVRAGTANSDSHSLVDSVLGTPRTVVWTEQTLASFDEAAFNADVRAGHMVGTNGPVIEATLVTGATRSAPSLAPIAAAAGATLSLRVTAAPWVPVDEVRIVVNGRVARTLAAELSQPVDRFGTEGVVRFEGELALSELLEESGDAWIVVEAGEALPVVGDLDCDGIPDTGDNDGSGSVDFRDVDRNDDDVVDARDLAGLVGTPACDREAATGPIVRTPLPAREGSRWEFAVVTPGGYAASFTNPLLVDVDGGGWQAPGLPGGAP